VNADVLFWTAIASLTVAFITALAARALRDFSRRELEELAQRRARPDRFSDILHHHDRLARSAENALVLLLVLAVTSASSWYWQVFSPAASPIGWWLLAAFMAALGMLLLITVVWLPWACSRVAAAAFLFHTWPIWGVLARLVYPLVWCERIVDLALHRMSGRKSIEHDEESLEEEIRTIVSEGHREGLIEEEAREMIEGVIELGDAVVSHIMTPRTEMHMLSVNTPWEEAVESIIEWGHTRVPVYEKTRDDVIGILYSKDLLPELAKGADEPRRLIGEILRKPLFVPETKAVDDLLQWFQKSRTHIAVVLDEYGGVSGLVTIEDVLEEIVGEIDDEYDQKSEDEIRKIDDDACEALGRAHLDEINYVMGFDLPEEEDFDTIGGFVFAEFGRVPSVGESITWQDAVRVTVLEATRRRVNRVRLERVRKESLELAQPDS
jgi:CBS domain containing-hemolysin-like protein